MAGTGFDIAASNFTVPPASVARTDTVVSWNFAYVADTPDSPFTPSLVAQVSQCGFTPLFSKSYTLEFINATLWSWADGQPSQDYYRNCALMDLATGRWITENCANAYPPACADLTTAPFTWVVDPASARQYDTIESQGLCKAPLVFAIPRTAQEHASLLGAMRLAGVQRAWISYNRVSPVCWVKGWQRPCPYQFPKDLLFGRLLGANLKQGIFILLVSVVFLIYQARSQWKASRENRRRAEVRKKIKQMEYRSVRKVE
ncbi:hypothetical protein BC831DRAFT_404556 [Entophlyctis helioformis]|nr:hypothetical protein BC831DRAFT_404556 [Entophlyctis helioformis]